jgi:hypothetical protein
LTDNLAVQVIGLRFINLVMFVAGLFVYRKVLLELGISRRLTHAVLLFFVVTPIVPLLAGQINYDNLIFLLTGLLFLYVIRFVRALGQTNTVDIYLLLHIVVYILFASIVKYTSVPLSLAIVVILASLIAVRYVRPKPIRPRPSIVWPKPAVIVAFALPLLVLTSLFMERYVVNIVQYHSLSPDCSKVLTIEECKSYSPWARDYHYAANYPKPSTWGIIVYPFVWVHRMVWETMFTISSWFKADGVLVQYVAAHPLTVANYTAWTIVLVGFALLIYFWRRLWRMTILRLLVIAILFYTFTLFIKNFSMYMHTGEAMAIHGRYLIPVFPVLYVVLALGFKWYAEKRKIPSLKTWLVIIVTLLLIHGAGLVVWLFRSDPRWYWSQDTSSPVYQINQSVQDVIHRVIIP